MTLDWVNATIAGGAKHGDVHFVGNRNLSRRCCVSEASLLGPTFVGCLCYHNRQLTNCAALCSGFQYHWLLLRGRLLRQRGRTASLALSVDWVRHRWPRHHTRYLEYSFDYHGVVLTWIRSVRYRMKCDVPQGAYILTGTFLFYTYDIIGIVQWRGINTNLYADDAQLHFRSKVFVIASGTSKLYWGHNQLNGI